METAVEGRRTGRRVLGMVALALALVPVLRQILKVLRDEPGLSFDGYGMAQAVGSIVSAAVAIIALRQGRRRSKDGDG